MSKKINAELPYLALGSNSEWGFLFSRTITSIDDEDALIEYMDKEAGATLDSILIIKNDQVIQEISPTLEDS